MTAYSKSVHQSSRTTHMILLPIMYIPVVTLLFESVDFFLSGYERILLYDEYIENTRYNKYIIKTAAEVIVISKLKAYIPVLISYAIKHIDMLYFSYWSRVQMSIRFFSLKGVFSYCPSEWIRLWNTIGWECRHS